jgi:hypothetical protein
MTLPFDRILTTDFETVWDTKAGYTLRKITTEEYIRHPRFKVHGCGVHEYGSDEPIHWAPGAELHRFFKSIDWSRTAIVAHNAQFDASILTWVYGHKPAFIFDTLSMARAVRGVEAGNSAAKLAQVYGLPDKGKAIYSTDGLDELPPEVERELADYCKHDVWLCEQFLDRLLPGFPAKELRLIDMTVRMYSEPMLELDTSMLADAIIEEKEKREALLHKLGVVETALASNDQFADLLSTLGVEPPTKTSKTTGETAFAFAKNDAGFQALQNGDDENIALLCEARLAVKSTLQRTRAQRFLDISHRGRLPVPLSYFGAGTGRWTAAKGSAINMQNLKRGSFLRKAIMAPEGHVLVVGDLSQIEPRVLAWLADYEELLAIFASGEDAYASFGAQMFDVPGMTKESHPDLRQAAKSALLGCGYGLGWASFAAQLLVGFQGAKPVLYSKEFCKRLGVTAQMADKFLDWDVNIEKMDAIARNCTDIELVFHCLAAKAIIDKYRSLATPIVEFWDTMTDLIETSLYNGKLIKYKCLTFRKEQIVLPSGMAMNYPNLRCTLDERGRKQWMYDGFKNGRPVVIKLYGGKVTNNVTQGSARCVMTDGMLRVGKRYPVKGTVHDEQIPIAPEAEGASALKWVIAEMIKEPPYMPGIPLAAEGGFNRRYGLAKN